MNKYISNGHNHYDQLIRDIEHRIEDEKNINKFVKERKLKEIDYLVDKIIDELEED